MGWRSGRKICRTECDINNIVNYLGELFNIGLGFNPLSASAALI